VTLLGGSSGGDDQENGAFLNPLQLLLDCGCICMMVWWCKHWFELQRLAIVLLGWPLLWQRIECWCRIPDPSAVSAAVRTGYRL